MEDKKPFWKRIAELNIIRGRAMQYLTILNFLMLLKVFLQSFDSKWLGIILVAVGLVIMAVIGYVDYLKIYPHELSIGFEKNIEWSKFRDSGSKSEVGKPTEKV